MTHLAVRVKPNSRKPGISVDETGVEIRVSEQPHDGRANEAARTLLAQALDIPRSRITLIRGARSKEKAFAVEGLEHDTILARLRAYAAQAKRS